MWQWGLRRQGESSFCILQSASCRLFLLLKRPVWRQILAHCRVFLMRQSVYCETGQSGAERERIQKVEPEITISEVWENDIHNRIHLEALSSFLLSPGNFLSYHVKYTGDPKNICGHKFNIFRDRKETYTGIDRVAERFTWACVEELSSHPLLCSTSLTYSSALLKENRHKCHITLLQLFSASSLRKLAISSFVIPSPAFAVIHFSDDGYSDWAEMEFQSSFNLHFHDV